jgi:hypothetical protein
MASPVARSPQSPHAISSPRFAVRMKVARLIQQLASGHPSEPLSRENQGDLLAGRCKILESGKRLQRGSHAHHAVMPRVAVVQFSLDVLQRPRILLDGNEHGRRHHRHSNDGLALSGCDGKFRVPLGGITDAMERSSRESVLR